MKSIQAMLTRANEVLTQVWKELRCRHQWAPVYHSYRCTCCGKLDKNF